jgi:hypothetical protein
MNLPDIWRAVGNRIGFFTKETKSEIPEAPGCYAWFIPLWIYSEDLRQLVRHLTRVLLYEPIDGGKREHIMKFNWDAVSVQVEKVPNVAVTDAKEAEWRRIMGDQQLRAAFEQALMEASLLMPPLYVGKADNLRVRYTQHVDGVGPQANVFHNRFTTFARSVGLPLTVSDLLFVCIKTDPETDRALRDANVNELLEHILMQLCRPPFSMR